MVLGAAGQAFFERLVTEPGSARKTMEMTLYRRGGDFRQKKDADLCILKGVMISLEYQQHSHDPVKKLQSHGNPLDEVWFSMVQLASQWHHFHSADDIHMDPTTGVHAVTRRFPSNNLA